MKKPKISLSKESIGDFFLHHGEKFVVGLFAALACGLVWGGIDAVRTKPAKPEQRPRVIVEQAEKAMKHIAESKGPPAETAKRPPLVKQIEPWKAQPAAAPAAIAEFSAPLSEERAKRSAPEVLPLVDLRVRSGWAVIAVPPPTAEELAAEQEKEAEADKDKKKGKKKSDPGDVAAGPPGMKGKNKFQRGGAGMGPMGEGGMMSGGMMAGMMGAGAVERGRLVPYCILTALVPTEKQQAAFAKATSGFQMQDDSPAWSDYRVERAEVPPGAAADAELRWSRVDLQTVAKAAEEWVATQPDIAPVDLVLDPQLQLRPMDDNAPQAMPYVLPLPMLAGDPWSTESLHPWVVEQMRKRQIQAERFEQLAMEEAAKAGKTNILGGAGGSAMPGMPPMGPGGRSTMPPMGPGGRGMMPPQGPSTADASAGERGEGLMPQLGAGRPAGSMPGMMPGGSMPPGMTGMMPGMMSGMAGMMPGMAAGAGMQLPEYRMFRFVDTTVEPGKTYRYRIRVSVRNPNYGLDGQYLTEPELAKPPVLLANWSEPSPPAHVPDKHAFLVRSLPKGETKKSKGGYEILVLAENPATGNYWLKSLVADLGGFLNMEKRAAKGADPKTAESVVTNGVLLDARGRLEESDGKKGAATGPSEPLELLVMREDGSFSVTSAADSKRDFDRYAATLEAPQDGKKEKGEGEAGGSGLFGGGGAGIFGGPPGGGPPAGGPGGRASTPPGTGGPGGRASTPPGTGGR